MANTTLKPSSARQYPLVAEQTLTYSHLLDSGVAVTAVKLPASAEVIGGALIVDTASNTGTSQTVNVGDAGNPSRYASNVDLKTAARTALTITGYVGDGSDIIVTPTNSGAAATAGSFRLQVQYIIAGRAHEAQTN